MVLGIWLSVRFMSWLLFISILVLICSLYFFAHLAFPLVEISAKSSARHKKLLFWFIGLVSLIIAWQTAKMVWENYFL